LSLSRITSIESISAPSSFTIGTFSASTFNFSPEEKKKSAIAYFSTSINLPLQLQLTESTVLSAPTDDGSEFFHGA
jgi:hypothetical protein